MRDFLTENLGLAPTLSSRLVSTIVVLIILFAARYFGARLVHNRVKDPELEFTAKKAVTYTATALGAVLLVFIWLPFIDNLATFLGLLSAGLAIALADVFLNLAGWAYIVFRRPFRVGDRIEIGDESGDVIDIRAFRFTILEIRDWVDADQSTGRVIHIPNGRLFRESVANFTEAFLYIWHEVPMLVTFESDWRKAESVLRSALDAVAIPEPEARRRIQENSSARDYRIAYSQLMPTVYLSGRDSGALLTGRILVEAKRRRAVEDAVWRDVLDAIADDPTVNLAYPTMRAYVPEIVDRDA